MLLVVGVDVSAEVAGSRSRRAKVTARAGLLAELAPSEIRPATAFLAGELPGGPAGIGWSTLSCPDRRRDRRRTTGTGSARRVAPTRCADSSARFCSLEPT